MKIGNDEILSTRIGKEVPRMYMGTELLLRTVIITTEWTKDYYTDKNTKVIIDGEVALNIKVDCYSITFQNSGHLTINLGARLRIWEGGITNSDAESTNYIKLNIDFVNNQFSELLLHPDLIINNHPMASVEWKSDAHVGNPYKYTRFCYSTYNGLALKNIEKVTATTNIAGIIWNETTQSWKQLTVNEICNSFVGITFTINKQTTNVYTYRFNGNLIGNNNTSLTYINGTVLKGNSYLGNISTKYILNNLNINNLSVYLDYDSNHVQITQENVNEYNKIGVLKHFIFINDESGTFTINYKEAVWDFSFELDELELQQANNRGLTKGALRDIIDDKYKDLPIFNPPTNIEFELIEEDNNEKETNIGGFKIIKK